VKANNTTIIQQKKQ